MSLIVSLRPLALLLLLAAAPLLAAPAAGPLLLDAARAGEALVAVGERGLVLRRAAPDAEWGPVPTEVRATLTGVDFATAEHGWAVGHEGVILASTDGGATWAVSDQAKDRRTSYLDVLALSEQHVIVIGAFGMYRESRDGGKRWRERQIHDEDVHLNRITRAPDGNLYIAGEMGALLRSTDAGRTWEALETDNEGSFYGVLPLRDGTLLAYGLRGRLYRSADAGDTWEAVNTGSTGLILDGAELEDGTIVLAGQARVCLASRDGGQTFRLARHDIPAVAEIMVVDDQELLTFGEAGVYALTVP